MVAFQNSFNDIAVEPVITRLSFVFIKHANRTGSYRIFAPYDLAKEDNYSYQKDLGKYLNQKLDGKSWQWHHIIAKYHLKRIYPLHTVEKLHEQEIPTVLIDQDSEHIDYNLLTCHGVHEAFDMPKEKMLLQGRERSQYLYKMKKVYFEMYEHDEVFCKVAQNVLAQM